MAEAKKTTKKVSKETALAAAEAEASLEASEKLSEMIETEAMAETIVAAEHEIKAEVAEAAKAAKAGKRSTKASREAEAKAAKESKKADHKTDEKPKPAAKKAKSKLERAGKKYREATKLVDKAKLYSLAEALELAGKTSPVKFDASVELHINLGVDPKQADQNVRDTVVMPAGTGKTVRIAVLAEPEEAAKAKAAGAELTDIEQVFAQLDKEEINFDVLICVPTLMGRLGKYARLLGPRGLMPNPKSGTVTANTATAVQEAKAGKVEYRVDQAGIVHLAIGKVSFTPGKLTSNASAVINSIKAAKPASLKNIYIKSLYVSSTMGPSVKVDTTGL